MGRRGPPPKPTVLRVLHGDRKDRINTSEPVPSAVPVERPEYLSTEARPVWDSLAPDLIRAKVLTSWDVDAFAALCEAVAIGRQAWAELARDGATMATSNGDVLKKHPSWQVARDAAGIIARLGARFGLTPADRAQLKIGESGDDEDDDLLSHQGRA